MESTRRKDKLKQYLDTQDEVEDLLPSTHIASAYHFDDIMEFASLQPQLCPIINEELTYFFYGRPSYRARRERSSSLQFDWPIVFILDTLQLNSIKRIFPFDSGAFQLGLYNDFFHSASKLGDFELPPGENMIRKIVRTFYITNYNYYNGTITQNFPDLIREFEVDGLREMALCPGSGIPETDSIRDERSTSIEIQTEDEFQLKDNLVGLVLPAIYLDHADTRHAIGEWSVNEIRTYEVSHNSHPEAIVGAIYETVRQMYLQLGLLKR